jgi:hypothetical protein
MRITVSSLRFLPPNRLGKGVIRRKRKKSMGMKMKMMGRIMMNGRRRRRTMMMNG